MSNMNHCRVCDPQGNREVHKFLQGLSSADYDWYMQTFMQIHQKKVLQNSGDGVQMLQRELAETKRKLKEEKEKNFTLETTKEGFLEREKLSWHNDKRNEIEALKTEFQTKIDQERENGRKKENEYQKQINQEKENRRRKENECQVKIDEERENNRRKIDEVISREREQENERIVEIRKNEKKGHHESMNANNQLVQTLKSQNEKLEKRNETLMVEISKIQENVKKITDEKTKTKTSYEIGVQGEEKVFKMLQKKFHNVAVVEWISKQGGRMSDISIKINGKIIMIEVKKLQEGKGVPKDQIERFYGDLENTQYSGGILLSLNGPVSNNNYSYQPHSAPKSEKPAMFIHSLSSSDDPELNLQIAIYNLFYSVDVFGNKGEDGRYQEKLKTTLDKLSKQYELQKKMASGITAITKTEKEMHKCLEEILDEIKSFLGQPTSAKKRKAEDNINLAHFSQNLF